MWCVVLAVALLVAGSQGSKSVAPQTSAALAMVGGDGFTAWYSDETTHATTGSGTWARTHGAYDLAGSGPDALGWWVVNTPLDASTVDLARFSWAFGRMGQSAVNGDEVFSLHGGEVRREVLAEGRSAVIYKGGLLELPPDVHAGSSWESTGTAIGLTDGKPGGSGAYTSQGTAATAADPDLAAAGCLDVSLKETYGTNTVATSETWCPGRGMVRFDLDGIQYGVDSASPAAYPVAADAFDWSRPSGDKKTWTLSPQGVSLLTLQYVSRPGVLPNGTVVVALKNANDVVALDPAATTGNLDRTVWRAHPGGVILTCVTLGQVTVATTSDRRVVAYAPSGTVLWTLGTPDSVNQPAVAFGGRIVVASVDGTVLALDPVTGRQAWRAKTPSELALQPVASGDTMVVIDESGTTIAYGPDGQERWRSTEVPASAYAISGSAVLVNERGASTVRGYDLTTGTKLWRSWEPDVIRTFSDLAGVALAYTTNGLMAFDPATGAVLWSGAAKALDVLVVGDRVVVATTDSLVVLDPAGREVDRVSHGLERLPQSTVYVASSTGSLVALTSTQLFREVSA